MLGFGRHDRDLEREIRIEMEYLTKLHGDDAARIALEKAARPKLRTVRRRVLEATARRLAGPVYMKKWALTASAQGAANQGQPASVSAPAAPLTEPPAPVTRESRPPEVDATVRHDEVDSAPESKVERALARLDSWMDARRGNAGQASCEPTSA